MNYYGQPGQPGHYNQSGQPGEQYYQYYPPPPPTDPKYDPNAHHQYSPHPVPPPSFSQSQSMGGGRAAIFFLLHFVAFIAMSVIALRNYAVLQRSGAKTGQDVTLNWSILWLLLVCVGIGFVLSIIYLALAHIFPRQFIKGTFIISIIFYWGIAAYFFVMLYFSMAILTAILALFYTLFWFWWRSMIPFSSVMLKTVTDITRKYKSMILVSFGGLFAETLFSIWWIFTFIAAYQIWYPEACKTRPGENLPAAGGGCENGKLIAIIIFLIFSYYWTSQVIQTWVHVTTSGVFATYYFLAGTPEGVPSSPTLKSAKRASTTSFGSICLGSLLVAILQVIGALLRSAAQDTDNPFGAFCAACAAVLVGCIESLLQYFNFYAYTQVAIYGKSFWESAKDTWTLVKDRGVEAIINDNLIGNVLVMGAFLVGIITALLSYLYTIIFELSFNHNGEFTPLIVFLGFIVGFQMLNIIGSVILSGTATTFVCLAEDPNALARTKPELYHEIRVTYPSLVTGM
ncbi:3272_t:CDS:10 [Funneliformis caledonium]|uniref:Protein PNS1 n=1 Tax=Funneliformis caledonium TaxID=1117310 RepID=A0A9N9DYZ9_9GLOM|nr:3272_t:CDS:10 [Funneliformis caledonium]